MSSSCEDDSEENDIFILKRLKPVGKLTKQKALEIKKNVLDREGLNSSFNSDVNSDLNESDNCVKAFSLIRNNKRKGGVNDGDDISILEQKINKLDEHNDGDLDDMDKTPVMNKRPKRSHAIKLARSPSKLILDYFSPTKRLSAGSSDDANSQDISPSDIESKKSKRLKTDSEVVTEINQSKSQVMKRKTNQNVSDSDENSPALVTKYFYSRSLKGIISNEIVNQSLLEQKAVSEGKIFQRLFSENEFQYVNKFLQLPNNAFEMFARMLCRKKGWHRICTISYDDIPGGADIFRLLNSNDFVDLDVDKESMETQLNLLNKSEVQILCKAFNIKVNGSGGKKSDFVDVIVRNGKSQRAITDMWKTDCSLSREQLLKSEINKALGPCMRLNESFLSILNRILLLFCLPHYVPKEDKWSSQIYMMTEIYMNGVSYPSYEIKPTVIFDNRDDFLCYEKAMELRCHCDSALLSKNTEEFTAIGKEAKMEFKKLLMDEGFKERIKNLPPFLRRYNAGSVYAKILTMYCEKYRRMRDPEEVVEIMEMLIRQDSFSVSKKGEWYILLVQAYSDLDKPREAGSTLLTALKGKEINEVERLQLQQKGGILLKKKKKDLIKGELRDELDNVCTIDLTEPSKFEIKARALDKNESGCKSVYMYRDKEGAFTFTSVEETAINYYKSNGFPQGVHAEGFIIHTMYFLVFFDIIYKLSPTGVFQSQYQTEPLDFLSSSFYLNRKSEIDARLKEMRSWSLEKYEEFITNVYMENIGVRCVITWKDGYNPKLFCDILRCLGSEKFTNICERLVRNFRVYRSGFPDLTVWNPITKKCKFVEVKSPNDKLSPNQRLWLDFLKKLDINCEVCNVKNIASKSVQSYSGSSVQ